MRKLLLNWNDFGIKTKLIVLFIIIKMIPLFFISFIAIEAVYQVEQQFAKYMAAIVDRGDKVIRDTANIAIKDSIYALDMKSQTSLERLTVEIAQNVSQFLHERDNDILFLSQIDINQKTLKNFYKTKSKKVTLHEPYAYDEKTGTWKSTTYYYDDEELLMDHMNADLDDNEREFRHMKPASFTKTVRPIYKEITFYDLSGMERLKVSSLNKRLKNIKIRKNTYLKAETYFKEASRLKKGQIYVSNVIGAYLPSRIIGVYNRPKAEKHGIKFHPEKAGYAGKENPVGKKFKAIIRFVTSVYKKGRKIGYITLALDHDHIMEYTDFLLPTQQSFSNISDGSIGNYAFMWDYKGRCISHVRDYFIVGFDPKTGKRVPGWVSEDLFQRYKKSNYKRLNEFLTTVPPFEEQSLKKKGSREQVKAGNVALDCRHLNHAPQCQGWYQLTEDGGFGSFIIFWSGVWKLTTAATIPYYTGQYGGSKRGFGFVTIGANVDEFHKAANETKENIDSSLEVQTKNMKITVEKSKKSIVEFIDDTINKLILSTLLMLLVVIFIAIWMSNSITNRIKTLIIGADKFASNKLDHRIEVTSKDEIGQLSKAFNQMAKQLNEYQTDLEGLIKIRTQELDQTNEHLKKEIINHKDTGKKLFYAMKKAEEANQAKSEFLANMSHELRTPMHGILGFAKLGAKRGRKMVSEKLVDYFSEIYKSGQILLELLNGLLDLSKLEAGKTEYVLMEQKISTLISYIIRELNAVLNDKQIKVHFELPDFDDVVEVDRRKISQVIRNLLTNAIKFSTRESVIDIEIQNLQTDLCVSIVDNGIGIPGDELDYVFDKFIQSSKSKTGAGGTGLGLSICKQIILDHSGRIWAVVNPEGGTILKFTIPKKQNKSVI